MTAHQARGRIFVRFLAAVLSSWFVGPIGVIYLHFVGWGEDPRLLDILLALSAVAPIQLLLNEYLASGLAGQKFRVPLTQLFSLSILAFAAASLSIVDWNSAKLGAVQIVAAAFTVASIMMSYVVSVRFYRLVLRNRIGWLQSSLIGALPGTLTLTCYLLAVATDFPPLLLISALAPATVQILYVFFATPDPDPFQPLDIPTPNMLVVGALALTLAVFGWLSAELRDKFASLVPGYGGVAIVALNLVGTGLMITARTGYLSAGHTSARLYLIAALFFAVVALLSHSDFIRISLVIGLCSIQLFIIFVISIARTAAGRSQIKKSDRIHNE